MKTDESITAPVISQIERAGDPVINVVLDELLDLTGWDPTSLFPEHKLSKDLELSSEAISEFIGKIERRFELAGTLQFADLSDLTLRDVVNQIKISLSDQAAA